jgi:hypothetical protein
MAETWKQRGVGVLNLSTRQEGRKNKEAIRCLRLIMMSQAARQAQIQHNVSTGNKAMVDGKVVL